MYIITSLTLQYIATSLHCTLSLHHYTVHYITTSLHCTVQYIVTLYVISLHNFILRHDIHKYARDFWEGVERRRRIVVWVTKPVARALQCKPLVSMLHTLFCMAHMVPYKHSLTASWGSQVCPSVTSTNSTRNTTSTPGQCNTCTQRFVSTLTPTSSPPPPSNPSHPTQS